MIPEVNVFLSTGPNGADRLVGRARFNLRRGRITTSFSYDSNFLKDKTSFAIDPSLPLDGGPSHVDGIPGCMRDSSPDRWGRHLISKQKRVQAAQGRQLRTLDEVDYLLGVHDSARQGALRYAKPETSDRLSAEGNVPPRISLPKLLVASNKTAMSIDNGDDVKTLLDAGSGSLGGARPKASVLDEGRILLAKFSHPGDEWDVMAWEHFSLSVAEAVGLPAPWHQLARIGSDSVLLLERFDREGSLEAGKRIPYISAMTILGAADGEERDYAEVAEAIPLASISVESELQGLFTRMALSIALHNTDDHLRNLGFVRKGKAWTLAPCFDVNPNPDVEKQRVTSMFGETGVGEAEGLKELSAYCGLNQAEAKEIIGRIVDVMGNWRQIARLSGCPETEFPLFEPVFKDRCTALNKTFG